MTSKDRQTELRTSCPFVVGSSSDGLMVFHAQRLLCRSVTDADDGEVAVVQAGVLDLHNMRHRPIGYLFRGRLEISLEGFGPGQHDGV